MRTSSLPSIASADNEAWPSSLASKQASSGRRRCRCSAFILAAANAGPLRCAAYRNQQLTTTTTSLLLHLFVVAALLLHQPGFVSAHYEKDQQQGSCTKGPDGKCEPEEGGHRDPAAMYSADGQMSFIDNPEPVPKEDLWKYLDEVPDDIQTPPELAQFSTLEGIVENYAADNLTAVVTERDQKKKDFAYERYAFNSLVSDRIGLQARPIPVTRHQKCKADSWQDDLPDASIIICYHNEALSVLIRMINTILERTPRKLLHEIILIDDMSTKALTINSELKKYSKKHWTDAPIKFYRVKQRQGLIRSKNMGALLASGKVLVFLDSHCEVNANWLEPLLERIAEDPRRVVCPVVDVINFETFEYSQATIGKGAFNWALNFMWLYFKADLYNNERLHYEPLRTPAMSGGLFAMDREYFHELGDYDWGMEIWGFENIEMSLRIWMCGGDLEIVPCSRVGHVFRNKRPYNMQAAHDQDVSLTNSLRVAMVWLDAKFRESSFWHDRPFMRKLHYGNVTDRIKVKERLRCKNFRWYVKNIFPELLPDEMTEPTNLVITA